MFDTDLEESPRQGPSKEQMMEVLHQLLQDELTDLQRSAFVEFHFQGKNMAQIARDRGVYTSTVSRTLRRAEKKLKRFTKYIRF